MNITMQNTERLTLEQIREFVEGSRAIGFASPKGQAVYEFIERVLKSQQYRRINRGQKGSCAVSMGVDIYRLAESGCLKGVRQICG